MIPRDGETAASLTSVVKLAGNHGGVRRDGHDHGVDDLAVGSIGRLVPVVRVGALVLEAAQGAVLVLQEVHRLAWLEDLVEFRDERLAGEGQLGVDVAEAVRR